MVVHSLTPVTEIDGRVISDSAPGNLTRKLQNLYQKAIEEEVNK